jgi:hypothetical protein
MPAFNLKAELVSEVGGFLVWGKTKATTQVIFEKDEFYIGEYANIRVIYDGSACKKAVKQFRFRLLRYARAQEKLEGPGA